MHAPAAIILAASALAVARPADTVIVALDMDPARPGIQASIDVPAGTTVIPGVAVYVYCPGCTAHVLSVGYLGGLDRGIALGHTPWPQAQQGQVVDIVGHAGVPINPGNTPWVFAAHQPGFAGPEVQYIEFGALQPAVMASSPIHPIFTADIHLSGATIGDVYHISLLDLVTVWRSGGGAFTPSASEVLTTGGDSAPDSTHALAGIDPDPGAPVPPAAFRVDYIDGGGLPNRPSPGGGIIRIGAGCWANCDGSTAAPIINIDDFTCFINRYAAGEHYANCDGSTMPPVLNIDDFLCFINAYAAGCP